MSIHEIAKRRPETTLTKACPAYKDAIDRYEKAVARGDAAVMGVEWERASTIAKAFWDGAAYAWAHDAAVHER